jgi:recombination protein RecA
MVANGNKNPAPGRAGSSLSPEVGLTLAQIEKQFGKGAIMRLGDRPDVPIEGISTGSIGLDIALGGQGLPKGRIVEVFGPESSGKTTLTLHVLANAQRMGGACAFIDAEHALDPTYAKKLGVDTDNLILSQPDSGEQALEICDMLVRSNAFAAIVVDSVAALVPKAELEGEMGDTHVGLQARLMSQAMRKLTGSISRSGTCVIFINQIREKVGVFFGSPETTSGGRALKFYSSVRLDIRRIGAIKVGEELSGTASRSRWSRTRWRRPSARRVRLTSTRHARRGRESSDMVRREERDREVGHLDDFRGDATRAGSATAPASFLVENADVLAEI